MDINYLNSNKTIIFCFIFYLGLMTFANQSFANNYAFIIPDSGQELCYDHSIHNKNNLYTWYDRNAETKAGSSGTINNHVNTEAFLLTLNQSQTRYLKNFDWETVYNNMSFKLNNLDISPITDQLIEENTAIHAIYFTVTDASSLPCDLTINVASSNPHLLTQSQISVLCHNTHEYTMTIQPTMNQSGISFLTITVNNAANQFKTTSFILGVVEINDAPIISSGQSFTINENSPIGTSFGPIQASDPDNNPLSYTVIDSVPEQAFDIHPSTGMFLVHQKIDYETIKTYTLTVRISDGYSSTIGTICVHVNNLDDNSSSDIVAKLSGTLYPVVANEWLIYPCQIIQNGLADANHITLQVNVSPYLHDISYSVDQGNQWLDALDLIPIGPMNQQTSQTIFIKGKIESAYTGTIITTIQAMSENDDPYPFDNLLILTSKSLWPPPTHTILTNTTIQNDNSLYEGHHLIIGNDIDSVTCVINGEHHFASVRITNNAVLTHSPSSSVNTNYLQLRIDDTFTTAETSEINLDGKGYLGGRSGDNTSQTGRTYLNATNNGSFRYAGGSYAGFGGIGDQYSTLGQVYGDLKNPDQPGSGGGSLSISYDGKGGNGGGYIRIIVNNIFTHNGQITANGLSGNGGGSGGSIYIQANTFQGDGIIVSHGGNGTGGGSGGRIAIYADTYLFKGYIDAYGGTGSGGNGAAGTVFIQHDNQSYGELWLDNHNFVPADKSTPIPSSYTAFDKVIINQCARAVANGLSELYDELFVMNNSRFYAPHLSYLTDVTIHSGGQLTASLNELNMMTINNGWYYHASDIKALSIHNDLTLTNHAALSHLDADATHTYIFNMIIHGHLYIDETSKIDVNGKGYLGGYSGNNSSGTGRTNGNLTTNGSSRYAGGSYGGLGGQGDQYSNLGLVYGDLSNPNQPGSGGGGTSSGQGGDGGGCIRLIIAQDLIHQGIITANGLSGYGGGSGGGIYIKAKRISGNGTISANGGTGSGGGGGGRIAIEADLIEWQNSSISTNTGGNGGQLGTIYFNGTMLLPRQLILNGHVTQSKTSAMLVDIDGSAQGIDYDHVTISGKASLGKSLQIVSNQQYIPVSGESFIIVSYKSLSTQFNDITLPQLQANQEWKLKYSNNALQLNALDKLHISAIENQITYENSVCNPIHFTVNDASSMPCSAVIQIESDNPQLISSTTYICDKNAYTLTITPSNQQTGSTTLSITVTNTYDQIVSESFMLTLVEINDPPIMSDAQSFTVNENLPLSTCFGQIIATDPESAPITYSILSCQPNNPFILDSKTGLLCNQSKIDFENSMAYTMIVSVSDALYTVTQTVNIYVIDEEEQNISDIDLKLEAPIDSGVADEYIIYPCLIHQNGPSEVSHLTVTIQASPHLQVDGYSLDQGNIWHESVNAIDLAYMPPNTTQSLLIRGKIESAYTGTFTTYIHVMSDKDDPYLHDNDLMLTSQAIWPAPNIYITSDLSISSYDTSIDGAHLVVGNGIEAVMVTISGYHRFASVTIKNQGTITHPLGQSFIQLVSLNDMIIETGGAIHLDAKGYTSGSGPGAGQDYGSGCGTGGSYGGRGGTKDNNIGFGTYGQADFPQLPGSGGGGYYGTGGAGGGYIHLSINNQLRIDGLLTVNGEHATNWRGGGSGGGVLIQSNQVSGAGIIQANGGNADTSSSGCNPGGGGGGRIALQYRVSDFTGTIEAKGGNGLPDGDDGTVVLLNQSECDLIIQMMSITQAIAGTDITYTLSIRNAGPAHAKKVVFTMTDIPAGMHLSYQLDNNPAWYDYASSIDLGDMDKQTSHIITMNGHVSPSLTGMLNIHGSVSTITSDRDISTNSLLHDATITLISDVSLKKTCHCMSVPIGSEIVYTLTAFNAGPSHARQITITDAVPLALTQVMMSMNQGLIWEPWTGSYHTDIFELNDSIPILLKGTITLQTMMHYIENSARIQSMTYDPDLSNNDAHVNTIVLIKPVISDITDQTLFEDQTKEIIFSAYDNDSSPCTLLLTIASSDHAIISPSGITTQCGWDTYTLTLIPERDASGSAMITITALDSDGLSDIESFHVSVIAVNDKPQISTLPDQTLYEDSLYHAIAFTVQDESLQDLSITWSSSNPLLISDHSIVLSGVNANRTLTFSPTLNAFGEAIISLTITDTSGESTRSSCHIMIVPVNDPPQFQLVSDHISLTENAGSQYITQWVIDSRPGPDNESSQVLAFLVTTDQPSLFDIPPMIDTDGTLQFTPKHNQSGESVVTVRLKDNAGTLNNGIDTSEPQFFTITIHSSIPQLTLSIQDIFKESDGVVSQAGMLILSSPAKNQIVINLQSTDSSELTLPEHVIIESGQSYVYFDVTIFDDTQEDGDQYVIIYAQPTSPLKQVSKTIIIQDNDQSVNVPPSRPYAVTPVNHAIISSGSVTLVGSKFYDKNPLDHHNYTYWRIRPMNWPYQCQSSMGVFCYMATQSDVSLTEYIISNLIEGQQYAWQIVYEDGAGEASEWSEESIFTIGTQSRDTKISISSGGSIADYCMKSFIVWPDNPSAYAVFKDDLSYGYDTQRYKIGTYDPLSGGYIEFNQGLTIYPGRSYWFLSTERLPLSIEGVYVTLKQVMAVELYYNPNTRNGWNMIGSPNNADYEWHKLMIYVYDDQSIVIYSDTIENLSQDMDNDYISPYLWEWQRGQYNPHADTLYRYNGYWVEARHEHVYLVFSEDARLDLRRRSQEHTLNTKSNKDITIDHTPPQPMGGFSTPVTNDIGGGCFIEMVICQ